MGEWDSSALGHRRAGGDEAAQHALTRRQLLASGAGGALALAGLLSGCGGVSTAGLTTSSSAKPRSGGTLRVGMITGGSAETLSVPIAVNFPDIARVTQLYDTLFSLSPVTLAPIPRLAASAERNADATRWVIRLRPGVTWHDGKPLTADDLLYTIRSWASPKSYFKPLIGPTIKFNQLRKRDSLTVEIPLTRPIADFPSLLCSYSGSVIQSGFTDFRHPVGTGPFKYMSFNPGAQSVFAANRDYWAHPYPYVDQLIMNTSFADETTRTNALLAGDIDVVPAMSFTLAKQQAGSSAVRVSHAHTPNVFGMYMRVDTGPTANVQVRQALRLIADRPALLADVLLGDGTLGNDVPGRGLPYFAESLTRDQDIEQAKHLLKAAGYPDLTLTLRTSTAVTGFVESATVYAAQAKTAGVNIKLEQISPANYFSPAAGYYTWPFAQTSWSGVVYSLTYFYLAALCRGTPNPETHWGSTTADRALDEALAAVSHSQAQERWRAVQELQFDQGGYILWANPDAVDGFGARVHGITSTGAGQCNGYDFRAAWLA
jgi:peptide/nickel transport system substrate-binding protein